MRLSEASGGRQGPATVDRRGQGNSGDERHVNAADAELRRRDPGNPECCSEPALASLKTLSTEPMDPTQLATPVLIAAAALILGYLSGRGRAAQLRQLGRDWQAGHPRAYVTAAIVLAAIAYAFVSRQS